MPTAKEVADREAAETLSPARKPSPRPAAEAFGIPPEDMLTEQEKDQSGGVPGVGPASASEVSPGPVETIEEQGIGPRTPYPDGDPPPTEEIVTRSQGIKKGTPRDGERGDTSAGPRAPATDPFGKPVQP
jgi:hypothetical protein